MPDSTLLELPQKPREDFPLYVHKSNRWAKKVRGKTCFFGKATTDPKGEVAQILWLDQKDDLLAGRKPRKKVPEGLTVAGLCNKFLTAKKHLLEAGELSPRTWSDYRGTTDAIVAAFGKHRLVADLAADDFAVLRQSLSKSLGPVALGNAIQRVRSVFKFAKDEGLVPNEIAYGARFKRPSKKVLRLARAERGQRLIEPADLLKILGKAGPQLKAMILLGVQAGMGNGDIAQMPIGAIDLAGGWLNYPRPKTGIERRVPLWKETRDALAAVLASRPAAKDPADAKLVFITKHGHGWGKLGRFDADAIAAADESTDEGEPAKKLPRHASSNNAISKEFKKAATEAGVEGRTFYDLRHVFATVAGGCRDQVAVNAIMGHADATMAAIYREKIDDLRFLAVVNHVHQWLYGDKAGD